MLDKLTGTDFEAHLNETFLLPLSDSEPLELELVSVSTLGVGRVDRDGQSHRAPFSLIFLGRHEGYLPQRIYHLEHPVMGEMDIFLVPIGPSQDGMRYEAIFT